MHPTEVASLEEIFAYLSLAIAAPSPPPSTLTSAHLETIIQILDRWPESQRFPGWVHVSLHNCLFLIHIAVIDLCRLMAAFCPNICTAPGFRERFIEALFKASDWSSSWLTPLPKHRETHVLLVLRTVANMFQEGAPITDGLWVNQVHFHSACRTVDGSV
jgi:phospholipase A-2-activating protein